MPNPTTRATTHTTSRPRQIFRAARLLLHIVSGLIQSAIYPHVDQQWQRRLAKNWSARLLSILSIRLRYQGTPPALEISRAMLAANHVSWLDVYSLQTVCPARFVAKAEIRGWPLLGWLSRNAGTLFIERSKRSDTARINKHISEALASGDRVAVFPEGTTGDGKALMHFHASLLQPAVNAEAMLYPVAIRYTNMEGEISTAAPYVNISMIESLRRILREPWINVELIFGTPIDSNGKNRRELARWVEHAIANDLFLPVPHKTPGTPSGRPNESQ